MLWSKVAYSWDRIQDHGQNLLFSWGEKKVFQPFYDHFLFEVYHSMSWRYVCPVKEKNLHSLLCNYIVFLLAGNLKTPEHFRYNEETALAWKEGRLSDDIVEEQRKVQQADLVIFQVFSYTPAFFFNSYSQFCPLILPIFLMSEKIMNSFWIIAVSSLLVQRPCYNERVDRPSADSGIRLQFTKPLRQRLFQGLKCTC